MVKKEEGGLNIEKDLEDFYRSYKRLKRDVSKLKKVGDTSFFATRALRSSESFVRKISKKLRNTSFILDEFDAKVNEKIKKNKIIKEIIKEKLDIAESDIAEGIKRLRKRKKKKPSKPKKKRKTKIKNLSKWAREKDLLKYID